jgi:hypothetical protein
VNLLVICAKIANRQASFSLQFPEFTPAPQVTYSQLLHWPSEESPERSSAFDAVSEKNRAINRADRAGEVSRAGTPAVAK